ncbi:histamine N-methyltransferase-like isoform X2 [Acanthaster planci]|nr:histamine N-methyltransferase-like isoform X2 [Acanthaster planci]XP_022101560.1 histamine N-methyltransferase-like isoform X2 [Acanthaster planci]XP_022101561.1 histamine N-methyltransferase-like isoform X2 [Acanthaster planci]XP_022101563.1 histamine N-methyltransferase-like isoform X2 [Acanthaster planci]
MENFDARQLQSLCNDVEHYILCTQQYEKRVAWLPDYMKWVNRYLAHQVLDKLDVTLLEGESLRLLGVGSGEGAVEYQLLSHILTKHPSIHNTVVEPSQTQVDMYKDLIKAKAAELDGVKYDWHLQTLGEYQHHSEMSWDKTKFHFISALYCLYYEPDLDGALAYLYSRLEPGGILLVGMETENCDMIKIEKQFQFAQDEVNPLFCTEHVCTFFKKHNIPYVICNQPDDQRDFDITDCFDDTSDEGSLVLDFLSNVLHFRQSVPPAVLKEFRDYLKSLVTVRDGKVFLFYDSAYILGIKNKVPAVSNASCL